MYSICAHGHSTKTTKCGTGVEKGLGFKKVFAVSSTPTIVSNQYAFQFRYSCVTRLRMRWQLASRSGQTNRFHDRSMAVDGNGRRLAVIQLLRRGFL